MDVVTYALSKAYTKEAVAGLWDKWSATTSYAKGQIVLYEGIPYQAKQTTTLGSFVASEWTQINISDALEKIDDCIQIVKLTDGTETLAQLNTRLNEINTAGKHVFFDTSAISPNILYLCTIYIDSYASPTKYRVYDCVTGMTAVGTYSATKTLATILSEAVADLVTITVTCTTQDGVTVTGQTVTLRNGTSSEAPVLGTKAYNGQPVTFVVAKDTAYYVSVSDTLSGHFNPTTATGAATTDTSVILTYSDTTHLTTFADIKSAVNAGAGDVIVGVEISDTWTNTSGTQYTDPMVVVSVETVQDADGTEHTAAIMQRKYASYDSIQFDAPELEVATGNYEASIYYYVSDSTQASTYRLLVAGTDYNVGDAISGTVYKNSVQDSTGYICYRGYNRYRDSAYRQYLNSDASVGNWWTAQHTGDTAPTQLNSVRGYKAGCSASLLAYAKPVKQNCYTNSVTDGSVVDTLCDLFWLPSGTQMYGSVNANEGTYWKYWKDATGLASPANDANNGRIQYAVENHSSAQFVRLRSAFCYDSYLAWFVGTSGSIGGYTASYSGRCVAACAIY